MELIRSKSTRFIPTRAGATEQSNGFIILISPLNYFWKVCAICCQKNIGKPERLRNFYFESQPLLWTVVEDTKMLWLFSSKYPPSAFKGFRLFH